MQRLYAGGVCVRHGAQVKRCSTEGCQKQAQKGDSDELKQFAGKTLPTLQEHLKMARNLTQQKK